MAARCRSPEPAAASVGTRIVVADLFFNQPARRKFQKTPATEQTHAVQAVIRQALACPDVHFIVRGTKRTLLDVPAATGCAAARRPRSPEKKSCHDSILWTPSAPVCTSTGFCARSRRAQAGDGRNLYCYVNRRSVRDRLLQRAVLEGYRSLLPHGRCPTAVIMLELPPHAVDVNVHPQKFDVRFADGQTVFSFIRHAVAEVLAKTPWLERGGARLPETVIQRQAAPSFSRVSEPTAVHAAAEWRSLFQAVVAPALAEQRSAALAVAEAPLLSGGFFSRLRVLAQFSNLYILCQGEGELVVVDQHAAHERITFEKLINAWDAGAVARQGLLFPLTIEARPDVVQLVDENAGAHRGASAFELSPFGESTLALKAIPAIAGEKKGRAPWSTKSSPSSPARAASPAPNSRMLLLARIAWVTAPSAAAIRSSVPEMEALLAELDGVDCGIRCPHGRPVVARLRTEHIGRWFEYDP